jgi:two-component system chemotaxis sensor kinase CheA
MNEFISQFLLESREFIEAATEDLLVLEQSPADAARLDSVFRAFHTLKGGAGIVEFHAMERAVHAAEEILSAARAGKLNLTTRLVGECLACLDQVLQWLEGLEQTGEFPPRADDEADAVVTRLRVTDAPVEDTSDAWVADLVSRHAGVQANAATALKFVPAADCFFKGEDPVGKVLSLAGLLAVDLEPREAWPALEGFDPYKCNLVITAITTSPPDTVRAHLKGHTGQCEVRAVEIAAAAAAVSSLPATVRDILAAQLALLDHAHPMNVGGFVASAGLAAENALRFCARTDLAADLARATATSLAQGAPEMLRAAIAQVLAPASDASTANQPSREPGVAAQTVRVDAARIDTLVRLTGEFTVAKNAVGHLSKLAQQEANPLAAMLKERHIVLDRLVSELQRSVLAMRVLRLRFVLQRFPRLVREMSAALGKPVKLEIEGEDTEADKAIVEMLFEPLLHIVRNALDHGIERPAERASTGKPAIATLRIRASRQGDQVLVEVSDDGGGIDVARVRDVARARGVLPEDALSRMSEAEIVDLVFAPGFSTATQVTQLSGRGVGMDAVRTAVERVGGRVAIDSRRGAGATVRFTLPFSVMMTQVMTVEAGGQTFGVLLDAVVETISVPRASLSSIGAAQAIVLRDRTIPVLDLASVLGLRTGSSDRAEATIVITAFAGQTGGLQVDRIGERLEVILKPLDGLLSHMPGVTGTTLLGDGRVLLVLDVAELLQ